MATVKNLHVKSSKLKHSTVIKKLIKELPTPRNTWTHKKKHTQNFRAHSNTYLSTMENSSALSLESDSACAAEAGEAAPPTAAAFVAGGGGEAAWWGKVCVGRGVGGGGGGGGGGCTSGKRAFKC